MAEQKTQDRVKQTLPPEQTSKGALATTKLRLDYPLSVESRYGVDEDMWSALVNAIYPNARTWQGVVLALEYCKRRKLDIMKRPVHIVPMRTRIGDKWVDLETVWPGITEIRITAFRTGQYVGSDPARFGPDQVLEYIVPAKGSNNDDHPNAPQGDMKTKAPEVTKKLTYPEWCEITVYRMIGGNRCAFPGPRVYWREAYATQGRGSDAPNEMWGERAYGQIAKCAESAALRAAFPEELGGEEIVEEVERRANAARDVTPKPDAPRPERSDYTDQPKPEEPKKPAPPIIEGEASKSADDDVFPGDKPLKNAPREPTEAEMKEREMREYLDEAVAKLNRSTDGPEIQGMNDTMQADLATYPQLVELWNTARKRRIDALNGRK